MSKKTPKGFSGHVDAAGAGVRKSLSSIYNFVTGEGYLKAAKVDIDKHFLAATLLNTTHLSTSLFIAAAVLPIRPNLRLACGVAAGISIAISHLIAQYAADKYGVKAEESDDVPALKEKTVTPAQRLDDYKKQAEKAGLYSSTSSVDKKASPPPPKP